MMPSLDHCVNNTPEMTTLSNTLEVFDTYKHREDKDSDEESFHLPLDDDELDTKVSEPIRNGCGNETEEDILNKFDNTLTPSEQIDSQLEESLLNDDEEEKKEIADKLDSAATLKTHLNEIVENGNHLDVKDAKVASQKNGNGKDTAEQMKLTNGTSSESDEIPESAEALASCGQKEPAKDETEDDQGNREKETTADVSVQNNIDVDETSKAEIIVNIDVPKINVEGDLPNIVQTDAIDTQCNATSAETAVDACKVDEPSVKETDSNNTVQFVDSKEPNDKEEQKEIDSPNDVPMDESPLIDVSKDDKQTEEKADDFSRHNDDSEDLFDISVIRDAEEDNAESAYNEEHPEENDEHPEESEEHTEENEEYDDRADDKMEEDCVVEKTSPNEEEDDEIDIDKQEDHLKNDDVDIEEDNLKLDCDTVNDSVSAEDSEAVNKTDLVQVDTEQKISEPTKTVDRSVTECMLDEVTGNLISTDGREINYEENLESERTLDGDKNSEDSTRTSLKRSLVEETEARIAKKSRLEQAVGGEPKEIEKPKDKLPLKTLLSLSDFMRTRKHNKRLTMHDLEEFCIQKICEVIVHKSELGDVHHQLKLQEQLIETMRKEIQQLTKQTRDLEIVNKKLMNDLKQQTTTQKPLNPLKITRSVGLQVKFTPTFEANLKRRQPNIALVNPKALTPATPPRAPRVIPNAVATSLSRAVGSPQKQQQVLPKPSTPLLSQALQNRRTNNENINKIPNQPVRAKPTDLKNGSPSASVIDLTDEDDKKDKNKNSPAKMVPSKNIAIPLRTTPMRVNATAQGIRLTTTQGKGSPITSVVTSSSPQVMYVVQSSPQNVLSPLGSKAVVVNFQSANGVLTSALNGSAVSVIPKQGNTIQLKTVGPPKALQNNKIMKVANKHPASLPPPPVVRINSEKPLKPIPPKPHLTIRKTDTGIILQWKMPYELDMYEVIASYQLYAYQETSALPSTDMWRKVGDVKALALPMACTLTQFADKNKYYFAVRPVDIHKRIGMFSEPEEISL